MTATQSTYAWVFRTNFSTQGSLNQCKPFEKAKTEYYKSFGYDEESQVDVINDAVS